MKTKVIVYQDGKTTSIHSSENCYKDPHTIILSKAKLTRDEVLLIVKMPDAVIEEFVAYKFITDSGPAHFAFNPGYYTYDVFTAK